MIRGAETRICPVCQNDFRGVHDQNGKLGGKIIKLQKYCSKACWSIRGRIPCQNCNKVFARTEGKKQIYCSQSCAFADMKDDKHANWKGDKVSYSGLHKWVAARLGKPMECEFCGYKSENPKEIHWANKSQEYKRDLDDWLRLCAGCHRQYDANWEKHKPNNNKLPENWEELTPEIARGKQDNG